MPDPKGCTDVAVSFQQVLGPSPGSDVMNLVWDPVICILTCASADSNHVGHLTLRKVAFGC